MRGLIQRWGVNLLSLSDSGQHNNCHEREECFHVNFVVKLRQNWLSLQLFVLQADATRSFAWAKMETGLLMRVGASCDFGLPLVRQVTGRALSPALFGVTLEPGHQTRFLNFHQPR